MEGQKNKQESILLTGGFGYIGSHFTVRLYEWLNQEGYVNLNSDLKIIIIDNLCNSKSCMGERITSILQESYPDRENFYEFYKIDVLDIESLSKLFSEQKEKGYPINYVVHFAGLKAVGESCQIPLQYFETNVKGTMNLLDIMTKYKCKHFLFSSSASVYGDSKLSYETDKINPQNPYANSKASVELLMKSLQFAHPEFSLVALRYFNPGGAHKSGRIGDYPNTANNLFPVIEQVIIGNREKLCIFGDDYETIDGTGVRDYIHIQDLADAHIATLKRLKQLKGFQIFNIGTGSGFSVKQIVEAYTRINKINFTYELVPRRDGDVAESVAETSKANKELEWRAIYTLDDICQDSYNFIKNNPKGIE